MNQKYTPSWTDPGGAIIIKTAVNDFDVTEEELNAAIKSGKLNYRHNTLYGNPTLKLLRSEVESYIIEKYGQNYLNKKKLRVELANVNKEINSAIRKAKAGEKRKAQLLIELEKLESSSD